MNDTPSLNVVHYSTMHYRRRAMEIKHCFILHLADVRQTNETSEIMPFKAANVKIAHPVHVINSLLSNVF